MSHIDRRSNLQHSTGRAEHELAGRVVHEYVALSLRKISRHLEHCGFARLLDRFAAVGAGKGFRAFAQNAIDGRALLRRDERVHPGGKSEQHDRQHHDVPEREANANRQRHRFSSSRSM